MGTKFSASYNDHLILVLGGLGSTQESQGYIPNNLEDHLDEQTKQYISD